MTNVFKYLNPHISDIRSLARCISLIENEANGYEEFLSQLQPAANSHVIGITGPPGAGKSTLTDRIVEHLLQNNESVAVLCIDPSSPFNFGAILGDRIRMSSWYNHPKVFIRSMASRGSLGGLSPMIVEVVELIKSAGFDKIIVETVGVGQSEVEIAGIADTTVVVLVPESGDDIQSMKAGVMEIADILVVNKSDRPGAEQLISKLIQQLSYSEEKSDTPVIKCIAADCMGINELLHAIEEKKNDPKNYNRKLFLQAQRLYQVIQRKKMKSVSMETLLKAVQLSGKQVNIHALANTICPD